MLAAFAPTLDNDWVGWDDPAYFLENTRYRGLGLPQLRWMFTSAEVNQYVPLAWVSWGLDYSLWGLQAWGYHLTSLLIHAIGTLLFFGLGRRLLALGSGADDEDVAWAACFSAILWAIHPLRVESVAWIAERRDVLSGAFFIGAVWLYVGAPPAGPPRRRRLAAAALVYAASLLSKATGVTLPLVLLLIDVYPLRRRPALREKLPFFFLSAATVLLTAATLERYGGLKGFGEYGVAPRLAKAAYNLLFHLRKTLWPSGLMAHYEAPEPFNPWEPRFLASAVAALTLAFCAWRARRRWPAVAAAAACYTVLLAPVSGLVRAGVDFMAADRFSYLPALAVSLALGSGFLALRRRGFKASSLAVAAAGLAVLGGLTRAQTATWKDSLTLWERVLSLEPAQALGNLNYGVSLAERGDHEAALRHCRAAAAADPYFARAHENVGRALLNLDRPAEARAALARFVELAPRSAEGLASLGVAALRSGDAVAALAAFDAALALRPGSAATRCRRAQALEALGRRGASLGAYADCLGADAGLTNFRVEYGRLLAASGRSEQAIAQYRAALYGESDRAAAHANWAAAALALGDVAAAKAQAGRALRLKPGLTQARLTLGNALVRQGRRAEAAEEYRRILSSDPSHAPARHNLRAIGGRSL